MHPVIQAAMSLRGTRTRARQGRGGADTGVVSATTTPPVVVWAPGAPPAGVANRLLDQLLIQVAPPPHLARLERPDHRVTGPVEVGRGVPVRGGVAAPDMPAGQAQPQVDPVRALPQAVLAALRGDRLRLRA